MSLHLRFAVAGAAVALLACNLATILWYGAASLDRVGTMTELPGWTAARAITQLDHLARLGTPDNTILSDASSLVVTNFEAASVRGRPLLFFSPYLGPYDLSAPFNLGKLDETAIGRQPFHARLANEIRRHNSLYQHFGALRAVTGSHAIIDRFILDPRIVRAVARPRRILVIKSFNSTLFNRWRDPGRLSPHFTLVPYESLRDYVIDIPSERTGWNLFGQKMLWRFEPDVFDRTRMFEAIGRYALFNVVNPTPRFRIELDYTTTVLARGLRVLPPASVLGNGRFRFPVIGDGAARLFSPPIAPQVIGGMAFVELDLGRDGAVFPERPGALSSLYGTQLPLDNRRIAAFVRDISAVSDRAYRALRAPHVLASFPRGLENPALEFSGLYEDGWMAHRAVLWLSAKSQSDSLTLRALVPQQAARKGFQVILTLDGRRVAQRYPRAGELVLRAAAPHDGRRHAVGIEAGPVFRLPGSDGRPATIRVLQVGFQ